MTPKMFSHFGQGSEPPYQASQAGNPKKGLGIPREADLEGQQDLIMGLPQDWGTETPVSDSTNKILSVVRSRGKEQNPSQETEAKLPVSVGGSPVEAWVGRGSPQGRGHWQQ